MAKRRKTPELEAAVERAFGWMCVVTEGTEGAISAGLVTRKSACSSLSWALLEVIQKLPPEEQMEARRLASNLILAGDVTRDEQDAAVFAVGVQ